MIYESFFSIDENTSLTFIESKNNENRVMSEDPCLNLDKTADLGVLPLFFAFHLTFIQNNIQNFSEIPE